MNRLARHAGRVHSKAATQNAVELANAFRRRPPPGKENMRTSYHRAIVLRPTTMRHGETRKFAPEPGEHSGANARVRSSPSAGVAAMSAGTRKIEIPPPRASFFVGRWEFQKSTTVRNWPKWRPRPPKKPPPTHGLVAVVHYPSISTRLARQLLKMLVDAGKLSSVHGPLADQPRPRRRRSQKPCVISVPRHFRACHKTRECSIASAK